MATMKWRGGLLVALLVPMAACSPSGSEGEPVADGDAPRLSASDAQAALQDWFDTHLQCTPFFAMPWDLPPDSTYSRKRAQAFVDAGLLQQAGEQTIADPNSGSGQRRVMRYVPTPEGAKQFRNGMGDLHAYPVTLCYGRPKVSDVKVESIDDVMLRAEVSYRYRMTDAPGWASAPSIQAFYPDFGKWLTREEATSQSFIYKDGKWAPERDPSPARYDLQQLSH